MTMTAPTAPYTLEQVPTLGPRRQRYNVLVNGTKVGWVIGALGTDWTWTTYRASPDGNGTQIAIGATTRTQAADLLMTAYLPQGDWKPGDLAHHDDLGFVTVLAEVPHNVLIQSNTNTDVAVWVCPQALLPVVQIGG